MSHDPAKPPLEPENWEENLTMPDDATKGKRDVDPEDLKELEDSNRLLLRLDPDPTLADKKFTAMQRRLVMFLECNKCPDADGLVGIVFKRVGAKLRRNRSAA